MSVTARSMLVLLSLAVVVSLPAGAVSGAGLGGSAPSASVGHSDGAGVAAQTAPNGTTASGSNASATADGTGSTDAGGSTDENGSTAGSADSIDSYEGAHVSVGVEGTALTNYTVDGATYLDSISVVSREQVQSGGVDAGAAMSGLSGVPGANLSVTSVSETTLRMRSETGAELSVHDDEHGIAVVRANRGTQYVQANVTDGGEATYEDDSRVVVTNENDEDASFIVVGNGSASVGEDGNVVAELGPGAVLVARGYESKRTITDKRREQFVSDGVATAEVSVMDRPNGTVVDVVRYENDTSLNVTATADAVNLTVDRAQRQGAVVFTSVENGAVALPGEGGIGVRVDGEAIPSANTYAQLRAAANNGPESRFTASDSARGAPLTHVAVAINRFPSPDGREVRIGSGEGPAGEGTGTSPTTGDGTADANATSGGGAGTGTDGSSGGTPSTTPGFGVGAALFALLAACAAAVRRR